MIINLDKKQKKLLLEIIAKAYQIEIWKGEDAGPIGKIIEIYSEALAKEGEEHIFDSVFEEYKPWK